MPEDATSVGTPPSRRTLWAMLPWIGLSLLVVTLDQLSKWVVVENLRLGERVDVLPFFSWVRWQNDGAAFSLLSGSGGRWFFVALAVGFAGFIIYELRRLPLNSRLMGWVYGLILGGALGNGVDRLFSGHVVDFVLVHYAGWHFPAFNVADSALSVGAVLWIGSMFVDYRADRRDRVSNPVDEAME
jgi:signal peptidase II